jgi:hypothetical protein
MNEKATYRRGNVSVLMRVLEKAKLRCSLTFS